MSLNDLRDEALKIAVDHGFTDATPGEDIALMHSELSEALEEIRNGSLIGNMHYMTRDGRAFDMPILDGELLKPCGVPSELADVIVRVMHFCGKHDIDIEGAVREKMAYNESRPFRHGGKKL